MHDNALLEVHHACTTAAREKGMCMQLLGGGQYNGQFVVFDMRKGSAAVDATPIEKSHRCCTVHFLSTFGWWHVTKRASDAAHPSLMPAMQRVCDISRLYSESRNMHVQCLCSNPKATSPHDH